MEKKHVELNERKDDVNDNEALEKDEEVQECKEHLCGRVFVSDSVFEC